MRKIDILRKIDVVDRKMLDLCNNKKRKMHPDRLTCRDLQRLLEAFKTVYELFDKCADKEE